MDGVRLGGLSIGEDGMNGSFMILMETYIGILERILKCADKSLVCIGRDGKCVLHAVGHVSVVLVWIFTTNHCLIGGGASGGSLCECPMKNSIVQIGIGAIIECACGIGRGIEMRIEGKGGDGVFGSLLATLHSTSCFYRIVHHIFIGMNGIIDGFDG